MRRIGRSGARGWFRGLACQRLRNVMQLVLDWPWSVRPRARDLDRSVCFPDPTGRYYIQRLISSPTWFYLFISLHKLLTSDDAYHH